MELQWPLIIFTTFVAWSMGVFGVQGALAIKGEGKEIQAPALAFSVVALVIAGVAVFFHLQHWERIFNGFGHLSSGITQELIAIVVYVVVAVVYFAMLRKSEDGRVPAWCGAAAIVISLVLTAVCAHSYMMASRPAWDSPFWPLAMIGEAFALGSLTVLGLLATKGEECALAKASAFIGSLLNAVLSIVLVVSWQGVGRSFTDVGYHFDPTSPTAPLVNVPAQTNVLFGDSALLVWAGVILVGSIVPLIASIAAWRKGGVSLCRAVSLLGLVCVLVGCIAVRALFYELGLSVFPLY